MMPQTRPIMLGIKTQLTSDERGKITPAEQYGIQLVSMAFLTGDDAPVIWRGPMLRCHPTVLPRGAVENIDYLLVDMPPGTGDVVLSLSQTVPGLRQCRYYHAADRVGRRHAARHRTSRS